MHTIRIARTRKGRGRNSEGNVVIGRGDDGYMDKGRERVHGYPVVIQRGMERANGLLA